MGCNGNLSGLILVLTIFNLAECLTQEDNKAVLYPAFIFGIHVPLVIIFTIVYWFLQGGCPCPKRKTTNSPQAPLQTVAGNSNPAGPLQGPLPSSFPGNSNPAGPLQGPLPSSFPGPQQGPYQGVPLGQLPGPAPGPSQEHHLTDITPMATPLKILIHTLWKPDLVGHGRDAPATLMRHINIKKIEVNKFPPLLNQYNNNKSMFERKLQKITKMERLSVLTPFGVETTGCLRTFHSGQALLEALEDDLNEHYLFHGTNRANIDSICRNGLVINAANKGLFGTGIYFAENPTKADQYTDRDDDDKVMFVMRVCLGELYIHRGRDDASHFKSPPCRECHTHDCQEHPYTCDSAVAGFHKLFREFIVYRDFRAFPEYVITYNRTDDPTEMKKFRAMD